MRGRVDRERLGLWAGLILALGLVAGDMALFGSSWWRAAVHAGNIVALVAAVAVFVDWTANPYRADRDRSEVQVLWPYRPRRGYPSVPAWLLVVLLFLAIGLLLSLLGLLDGSV